jgi:hypothetical protein
MNFNYKEVKEWPFLSWLVLINKPSECVVFHGSEVETHKDFFCEAVWDRDFEKGDLDETDIIFGSGGRIRKNVINFAASSSMLDRLHHYESENEIVISNSLVCLLYFINDRLDPTYKEYFPFFLSLSKGINGYYKKLQTLNYRTINITYYNNLMWNGKKISEYCKKQKKVDLSTFNKYFDFLSGSIDKLFKNASDMARNHYLKKLGSISSGYDSPTVTALAKECGLKEVISFVTDRGGGRDCGDDIAKIMGVKVTEISKDEWKKEELSEIPFIAAESRGEDVQFSSIPDSLIRNCIFLTGYHGDTMWKKTPVDHKYSDGLIKHGTAGLSLAEYRLWKGFIHIPVPFIGVKRINDIHKITHLAEMEKWNVDSHYNRPICRRVVEGLGVPRSAFGQKKRVTTVELSHRWSFITENSQKDFYLWLIDQRKIFKNKGAIFPDKRIRFLVNLYRRITIKVIKISIDILKIFSIDISRIRHSYYFKKLSFDYWFSYLFPWAVEKAKERYHTNQVRPHR